MSLVCGAPREGFDALRLLDLARELQPTCERILLAEEQHWEQVAAASADGRADRLVRLPMTAEVLRQIVEEALVRRRLADDYGRLSEEMAVSQQELMRVEQERRRLTEENLHLQRRDQQGYAVLQEIMSVLPWPVVAVDHDGLVVLVNPAAAGVLADQELCIGCSLADRLPQADTLRDGDCLTLTQGRFRIWWREINVDQQVYGRLMLLQREES